MCPSVCDHGIGDRPYDGYHDSKLYKINLTAVYKLGTIEFRVFSSRKQVAELEGWIDTVMRLCALGIDVRSPSAEEILERGEEDMVFNMITSLRVAPTRAEAVNEPEKMDEETRCEMKEDGTEDGGEADVHGRERLEHAGVIGVDDTNNI
jgi:hypothetical protein